MNDLLYGYETWLMHQMIIQDKKLEKIKDKKDRIQKALNEFDDYKKPKYKAAKAKSNEETNKIIHAWDCNSSAGKECSCYVGLQ